MHYLEILCISDGSIILCGILLVFLGQDGMFFCSANESFPSYFAMLTSSHHLWYLIWLQVMDSGVFYVIEKNNTGQFSLLHFPTVIDLCDTQSCICSWGSFFTGVVWMVD
jgi:hypothetical protein